MGSKTRSASRLHSERVWLFICFLICHNSNLCSDLPVKFATIAAKRVELVYAFDPFIKELYLAIGFFEIF